MQKNIYLFFICFCLLLTRRHIIFSLKSQTRTKRPKKAKNVYYKCFLKFILATINGLRVSVLSKKFKIVVPYSTPLWEKGRSRSRIQEAQKKCGSASGSPTLITFMHLHFIALDFLTSNSSNRYEVHLRYSPRDDADLLGDRTSKLSQLAKFAPRKILHRNSSVSFLGFSNYLYIPPPAPSFFSVQKVYFCFCLIFSSVVDPDP